MAEEYSGVKFKVILKNCESSSDVRIDELRYWCRVFHEKNLAPPYPGGSYGNLSFRIKPGENDFIITGTCIGLKNELDDSCFVKVTGCDLKEKIIYAAGQRYPSSESMLHYSLYNARPDVQAIFHGHAMEFFNSEGRISIIETKTEAPYGSVELVNNVLEILNDHNFILLKNHGFVSLGVSLKDAGEHCHSLLRSI